MPKTRSDQEFFELNKEDMVLCLDRLQKWCRYLRKAVENSDATYFRVPVGRLPSNLVIQRPRSGRKAC